MLASLYAWVRNRRFYGFYFDRSRERDNSIVDDSESTVVAFENPIEALNNGWPKQGVFAVGQVLDPKFQEIIRLKPFAIEEGCLEGSVGVWSIIIRTERRKVVEIGVKMDHPEPES